jgi:hypothetical protein
MLCPSKHGKLQRILFIKLALFERLCGNILRSAMTVTMLSRAIWESHLEF